ncbi:MAG: MoaD/ThiS family protein [Nocardioides sp.]|nr:MoaD/ThiS family protein [Nocardioides sp.]
MSERSKLSETNTIRVRYWAAARAAAGVNGDELAVTGPISLAEVVDRVARLHPDTRLLDVIGVCSVLLGDRPVSTEDPAELLVPPGSTLEFLPPFAGG